MAKKTTKKVIPTRSRIARKTNKSFKGFIASLKHSPKKALFVLAFALIGAYFVISVLAASLCPTTSTGTDGADGADETCVATRTNPCNGADGTDVTGSPGADGHGEDVITAPGTDGVDGSSSADGADGTPSAPTSPGTPGAPATGGGTICTTRNGVKTCRNL